MMVPTRDNASTKRTDSVQQHIKARATTVRGRVHRVTGSPIQQRVDDGQLYIKARAKALGLRRHKAKIRQQRENKPGQRRYGVMPPSKAAPLRNSSTHHKNSNGRLQIAHMGAQQCGARPHRRNRRHKRNWPVQLHAGARKTQGKSSMNERAARFATRSQREPAMAKGHEGVHQ